MTETEHLPTIGMIHDAASARIADTYSKLLGHGAYHHHPQKLVLFDPLYPERTAASLNVLDAAYVMLGLPGSEDYRPLVHDFLDLYIMSERLPAIGLVTHDIEHTRYTVDSWLNASPHNSANLPDGRFSIIDASRPVRAKNLEKATGILLHHAPEPKPAPRRKRSRARLMMKVDSTTLFGRETITR